MDIECFSRPCSRLNKQLPKAACNLPLQDMTAMPLADIMALQQRVRYARSHAFMKEHSQALRRQVCIFWEASALSVGTKALVTAFQPLKKQTQFDQGCLASCTDPEQQDQFAPVLNCCIRC